MPSDRTKDKALFQSLFTECSSIMLIIDPKTRRILDANKAALEYYGYAEDEIIGMDMKQINILSETDINKEISNAVTMKRGYFNFRHQLKNGETRDVEVYSGPIEFNQKKVLYSIVHDISEKKKVQEILTERESTIKAMINATQSLVFLIDTAGTIINLNEPAARMFNKNADEMIGDEINIFFNENDLSRLGLIMKEVVNSGEPHRYQRERGGKYYDVCFYPVFDSDSRVYRVCVFANDVTVLKKTESVIAAVETAGGICHEMNQPLQVLLGNLELLKIAISETDPTYAIVNLLLAQTEKLGAITKKLTNITRYETKQYMKGTIFDIDRSSEN